jgi:signal transduction histidine kinase
LGENAELDTEMTEIVEVFSAIEAMFKSEALERRVDLRIVPCGATVSVPPFDVLRVLSNLTSNAVRYAPGERVLVGARRRGDRLSLEVHDSGPGMSAEELERCRKRTARGDGVEEGYGLGLSIVARLVDEYDLEWHIDSIEGQGTRIRVLVPTG